MESGRVRDKIRFFLSRASKSSPVTTTSASASSTSSSSSGSSSSGPSPPTATQPWDVVGTPSSPGAPLPASSSTNLGSSCSTPSAPDVLAVFPEDSPNARLLEEERKSRFIRNLRFFKEASKRHINDFHQSPAGSKYRSSSSPDIQQLVLVQQCALKLNYNQHYQLQQHDNALTNGESPPNLLQDDTKVSKKRSRTLLSDFQYVADAKPAQIMSDSAILVVNSNDGENITAQVSSSTEAPKAYAESTPTLDAAGGAEGSSKSASPSYSPEGVLNNLTRSGGTEEASQINEKSVDATGSTASEVAHSNEQGQDGTSGTPDVLGPGKPSDDLSGTAIMYRIMGEGAAQQPSSDSNTFSKSENEKERANTQNGSEKKPSTDGERKKGGGLIAKYKNLVASMDKERERNPDTAKSLTESAITRKKKKEEEWEKDKASDSETRRKKRSGGKKEKSDKKEELAKKKISKSSKKKKKKMKESGGSKRERRSKKEGLDETASAQAKAKDKAVEISRKRDEPQRQQQEVDERLRETLRKLSITPPPRTNTNGEIGVHVIRRRLMTGDPFTVVLHTWPANGRGAVAKAGRSLGSKFSRLESDGIRQLDSATESVASKSQHTGRSFVTKHDSSGRESGSERKRSALPPKEDSAVAARTDIRLFGVDGQLVVEESDEGEDGDQDMANGCAKQTRAKRSCIKLESSGGAFDELVVEGSDDEEWEKSMRASDSSADSTSKAQKKSVADAEEDDDEDWEKELQEEDMKKNQVRGDTNANILDKTDESEEEDWDKELAEEEIKRGKCTNEKTKPLIHVEISDQEEDWEKEFASSDEPRSAISRGGEANVEQKAAAEPEEDEEDWDKELELENERNEQARKDTDVKGTTQNDMPHQEKQNVIALDLEPVKQQESLSKWEEADEDWDDNFSESIKSTKPSLSGQNQNSNRSEKTVQDTEGEDEEWMKAFSDGGEPRGKGSIKIKKKSKPKRLLRKEEKARTKEKEEATKRTTGGSMIGKMREKRKRTKSSAAARRIEIEGRQPSPHSTTSTPSTPRSLGSSRASSCRSLRDEETEHNLHDSDHPPKGSFMAFKVQYLHSRSPKWIERERHERMARTNASLEGGNGEGDKLTPAAVVNVANMSILASFSSFLSPRIAKKDSTIARLGKSNRDLSTPNSREGSNLSSSASAIGPYVPFHPPAFETTGWDPVHHRWSKRMYRAHYADDLAVTQRLLNEDLVLIHDQVFRFDARGVLYSWSPGSKVRETNFYDVYTSLVEKEGESGDEVGYLADL